MPMGEDSIFEIGDVALEAQFLHGVGFPISVYGSALDGAGPYLLLHLGLVPHSDGLESLPLDFLFCNNV